MIIVPALTECNGGYQNIVSRIVTSVEPAVSPEMGCRIYQPGKMPTNDDPQCDRPKEHPPTADREQADGKYDRVSNAAS